MSLDPLSLALFFEFTWPMPEITEDELAQLQWEEERRPGGSYTIHEISPPGPRIELKATMIEEARIEAADNWEKRTSLNPSDEPPTGYAVLDLYCACMVAYNETENR